MMHINEIYHTNELGEDSTSKKLLPVQKEGNKEVKRNSQYYNLDENSVIEISSITASDGKKYKTKIYNFQHNILPS